MRKGLYFVAAVLLAVAVATSITGAATPTPLATPVCVKTDGVNASVITCPTVVTTTTSGATTTLPATTTVPPTTVATTTTQPAAGSFLSYPRQPCTTSINGGTNVVVSNKSWQGCTGRVALVISGATNVYLHDLDFAENGGDIFVTHSSGQIRIERIRARNTGDGTVGSGHSNVIQLNNTFDNGTGGIRGVKSYGGRTEDAISIFQSGGIDSAHPLVIEDVHIERPLPPDANAWSSTTSTCINLADAGGHDILLRNSTFLNCGAVGIQMNQPTRVVASNNVVYGAARASSNVGLSQWAASSCSTCTGNSYSNNRVWWVKPNGGASSIWLSGTYPVSLSGNVSQDTTINPSTLKVVL